MDKADDRFVRLIGGLNGAMAIVTTSALGNRAGCLLGFHCQCGIEPQRYATWLSKANYTYGTAVHATHLAVHFLGSQPQARAEKFGTTTGDDIDKFQPCSGETGPAEVRLLTDCRNRLVGRCRTMLDDGGDHVGLVLEPVRVEVDALALRLHDVGDLSAGHDADDHPR